MAMPKFNITVHDNQTSQMFYQKFRSECERLSMYNTNHKIRPGRYTITIDYEEPKPKGHPLQSLLDDDIHPGCIRYGMLSVEEHYSLLDLIHSPVSEVPE